MALFTRLLRFAALLGRLRAVVAVACGACLAAPVCADPVEDLRKAVNLPGETDTFRKDSVKAAAAKISTLGDLRRALAMPELIQLYAESDVAIRKSLGERFQQAFRVAATAEDANARLAAAVTIAEMSAAVPGLELKDRNGFARTLTKDVVALALDADPATQLQGLRALSNINAEPKQTFATYSRVLAEGSVSARRLSAQSLGHIIRVAYSYSRKAIPTDARTISVVVSAADLAAILLEATKVNELATVDADPMVRLAALETLSEAGKTLSDLMNDPMTVEARKSLPAEGRPLNVKEREALLELHRKNKDYVAQVGKFFVLLKKQADAALVATTENNVDLRLAAVDALEGVAQARTRLRNFVFSVPRVGGQGDAGVAEEFAKIDPLATLVNDNASTLGTLLKDQDPRVRRAAAEVLQHFDDGSDALIATLTAALQDSDRFVRFAAVRGLSRQPVARLAGSAGALGKLLEDSENNIRLASVTILERLRNAAAPAAPQLSHAVATAGPEIKVAALKALSALAADAAPAVPQMMEALKDRDVRVRRAAALALGQVGSGAQAAVAELRRALGDDDQEVRVNAGDAILSILIAPGSQGEVIPPPIKKMPEEQKKKDL